PLPITGEDQPLPGIDVDHTICSVSVQEVGPVEGMCPWPSGPRNCGQGFRVCACSRERPQVPTSAIAIARPVNDFDRNIRPLLPNRVALHETPLYGASAGRDPRMASGGREPPV